MCGIAGIFDLKGERGINREALTAMTRALAHRGPDGEGFFERPGIGLGHRRLAVIDLEGGAQPFIASDGESAITYNGEVYNYRALRDAHSARGLALKTRSDTEAIAEGMLASGGDYIERLNGMFALAFHDAHTKTLTLARDRFGEKPLYYAETPDGFLLFASEIGALLASGLIAPERDNEAIHDYFLYGYIPDPKSAYRGVFKLPPASILTARRGRALSLSVYWRADFSRVEPRRESDAEAELLTLFDAAVGSALQSEVPLGAFLSGGVDSSAIVASMAAAKARIATSTIGFSPAKFDERARAAAIAKRYASDHAEEEVRLDATALIDRIAAIYGEPFADPSALPTYEVARIARKRVSVALSGDGGDEIFAGYRRYPMFAAEERVRRLAPAGLRRASFGALGALWPKLDRAPRPLRWKTTFQALGEDSIAAYARGVSACLPDRLAMMLSGDFKNSLAGVDLYAAIRRAAGDEALDPVSLAQKIDIATWLPGRMLVKVDRAAMAHGLETRAPFLDHRLAEFAFTLSPDMKIGADGGKHILKRAMAARIGDDIIGRPKQGFSPPVAQWLRADNGPLGRLRQSRAWAESGIFDVGAIEAMAARHREGSMDYSQELWSLIMFDAHLRGAAQSATSSSNARAFAMSPA